MYRVERPQADICEGRVGEIPILVVFCPQDQWQAMVTWGASREHSETLASFGLKYNLGTRVLTFKATSVSKDKHKSTQNISFSSNSVNHTFHLLEYFAIFCG